jgi:hypothetical protein
LSPSVSISHFSGEVEEVGKRGEVDEGRKNRAKSTQPEGKQNGQEKRGEAKEVKERIEVEEAWSHSCMWTCRECGRRRDMVKTKKVLAMANVLWDRAVGGNGGGGNGSGESSQKKSKGRSSKRRKGGTTVEGGGGERGNCTEEEEEEEEEGEALDEKEEDDVEESVFLAIKQTLARVLMVPTNNTKQNVKNNMKGGQPLSLTKKKVQGSAGSVGSSDTSSASAASAVNWNGVVTSPAAVALQAATVLAACMTRFEAGKAAARLFSLCLHRKHFIRQKGVSIKHRREKRPLLCKKKKKS